MTTPREALEKILALAQPAGEDFGNSEIAAIAREGLASGLFQSGDFTLSSGMRSSLKIECDALTDADWKTLATAAFAGYGGAWGEAVGVPRGGLTLARYLNEFSMTREEAAEREIYSYVDVLVVDDVVTTGKSLSGLARAYRKQGKSVDMMAAFSRGMPYIDLRVSCMITMAGWMNFFPRSEDLT